jgi:hypothetical protein
MPKPVLGVAAVAVAGVILWKLTSIFFLPLLLVAFKIALIAGVVLLAIWWINNNKKKDEKPGETPAE